MRSQVASEILMHWVWNGNEHVIEICMVTQLHVIWNVHADNCYFAKKGRDGLLSQHNKADNLCSRRKARLITAATGRSRLASC